MSDTCVSRFLLRRLCARSTSTQPSTNGFCSSISLARTRRSSSDSLRCSSQYNIRFFHCDSGNLASPMAGARNVHQEKLSSDRGEPSFSSLSVAQKTKEEVYINDGFDVDTTKRDFQFNKPQICECPDYAKSMDADAPVGSTSGHSLVPNDPYEPLPPPLPEPKFTFLRRVLNKKNEATSDDNAVDASESTERKKLVALDSTKGRSRLMRALGQNTAVPYFALQNHFTNQSDPAYCGVTSLLMVLNAFAVDPFVRWKGGWRYFGNEDVLLHSCCMDAERIKRVGIKMAQFAQMAACHGLDVVMKRPRGDTTITGRSHNTEQTISLEDFRADVTSVLTIHPEQATHSGSHNGICGDEEDEESPNLKSLIVVSYARSAIGQTGAGHFSPLAAYDSQSDSVLVLDVARFKYPPYWIDLQYLYEAMFPLDSSTQKSRGWFVLKPPPLSSYYQGSMIRSEAKRPVEQIPAVGDDPSCPAHPVKIEYCPNNSDENEEN